MRPIYCLFVALIAWGFDRPANAQVIEIGHDGQTITYDRPTLFIDNVARPLVHSIAGSKSPPPQPGEPPVLPMQLDAALSLAARVEGLAPELLAAVAWQESRGRSDAVSPKGAIGVMQLMPGTARAIGVNPHDTTENILGGARYLRQQIDRFGTVSLGLAAYNAGPGAVSRFRGIPPFRETRAYVSSILARIESSGPPHLQSVGPAPPPQSPPTYSQNLLIEVPPS